MSGIAVFQRAAEVRYWCRNERLRTAYQRVFSASDEATLECEKCGLSYEILDDFHDLNDVARITKCAHELSLWWEQGWVQDRYPELQKCHGISIGPALELPFYHVFAEAVRSILIATKVIDTVGPTSILAGEEPVHQGGFWIGFSLNLQVDALCLVAENKGIPVRRIKATGVPAQRSVLTMKILRQMRLALGRVRQWITVTRGDVDTAKPWEPDSGSYRRRVLVYAEGRHAETLEPLIREMSADSQFEVIVLTQDMPEKCQREIAAAGGLLYDAEGRFGGSANLHARRVSATLRKRWERSSIVDNLPEFGRTCAGISLWPLVQFQFAWLFDRGIEEIVRRTLIAESTLRALGPDLLLTPVDSSANDLCWILTASAQNIPTLTQLHGAVYVRPTGYIWGRSFSDRIAVWGPLMRQWHIEETGRAPAEFVSVGYPYFDAYRQRFEGLDRSAILRRIGLVEGQPVILFLVSMTGGAVGPYYRSQRAVYASFFESLRAMPNVQAIIRTHPASDSSLPRYIADAENARCVVNPRADLVELLKVSDIVVGQPTTAMVEAMLVRKPVVFFSVDMAKELLWWLEHGKLRVASGARDLAVMVGRILGDRNEYERAIGNQDEFAAKVTGVMDGHASARTISLAKNLMSEKRQPIVRAAET